MLSFGLRRISVLKLVFAIAVSLIAVYRIRENWNEHHSFQLWAMLKPYCPICSRCEECRQNSHSKIILVWVPLWDLIRKDLWMTACMDYDCILTDDRTVAEQADAVVFKPAQWLLRIDVPSVRHAWQRYVFFSLERGTFRPYGVNEFTDFYNWTMSYRLSSDVYYPYGAVKPYRSAANLSQSQKAAWSASVERSFRRKTRMVAWFVSHCHTQSNRDEFVQRLRELGMSVDVYGSCGTLQCDVETANECHDMLERKYFFYLSLENAICTDYATEKLYNALQRDIIPIVFERGIVDAAGIPSNAVIAVDDFPTTKDLVNYLHHLAKNVTTYQRHLEWKLAYRAVSYVNNSGASQSPDVGFCALCKKLIDSNAKRPGAVVAQSQVLHDFRKWWVDEADCHGWQE